MKVILADRVEIKLLTSGQDDRKKILAWFEYLKNWEEDDFARSRSVELEVQGQSVYLFRTTTEYRIFYTVDPPSKTIEVIDFTTKETILAHGNVAAGAS